MRATMLELIMAEVDLLYNLSGKRLCVKIKAISQLLRNSILNFYFKSPNILLLGCEI